MAGDRTIPRLWRDALARNSGTAYLVDEGESWHEVTWQEAAERVELIANGLLSRGVRKGDAFAILARTTLEWALFDFALAHVGAITVGIYANSSPPDVRYVLSHSEAVGVLCEDEAQRAKVELGREELPDLREILTYADLAALEDEGRAYREAHPARARRGGRRDRRGGHLHVHLHLGDDRPAEGLHDPPSQLLRDGRGATASCPTTAPPTTCCSSTSRSPTTTAGWRISRGPYLGYTTAFLPEPLEVARAMPQVRPTILPSVPRVYEKVHTAVTSTFAEATGVKRRLVDWSLGVGRRASELRQQGKPVPRGLSPHRSRSPTSSSSRR